MNDLELGRLFVAAGDGRLPTDFDQWGLADEEGNTVAHAAARHGPLPEGFSRWDLAAGDGWTVAHVAAIWGNLPVGFAGWDWRDQGGQTVRQVAEAREERLGRSGATCVPRHRPGNRLLNMELTG